MKILITGGAGFIGTHAAMHFSKAHEVMLLDNLSREGSKSNLVWLQQHCKVQHSLCDIRDSNAVTDVFKKFRPDATLHLAAQVAVTSSVVNPRHDFEVNAAGTFNLLEAARAVVPNSLFLYSSTNKVYGGMEAAKIVDTSNGYRYADLPEGISENFHLDFHSPYGCSKGSADQYVRDFQRIYGLKTVVFRQSCIYGTRQFGVEDQGWLAWFAIAAATDRSITIFGDGNQVRDLLWVEDLVAAFDLAIANKERVQGQVFNMGGGPERALSLLQAVATLETVSKKKIQVSFEPWRPGDQRVFIADIRKAKNLLSWQPKVSPLEGVRRLYGWVQENHSLFTNKEKRAA